MGMKLNFNIDINNQDKISSSKINFYRKNLHVYLLKDFDNYNSTYILGYSLNIMVTFFNISKFLNNIDRPLIEIIKNSYLLNFKYKRFRKLSHSVYIANKNSCKNINSYIKNTKYLYSNFNNLLLNIKSLSFFKKYSKTQKKVNDLDKMRVNYNIHTPFKRMRLLFYKKKLTLFTPYVRFKKKQLHLDLYRKYSPVKIGFLSKRALKNLHKTYSLSKYTYYNNVEIRQPEELQLDELRPTKKSLSKYRVNMANLQRPLFYIFCQTFISILLKNTKKDKSLKLTDLISITKNGTEGLRLAMYSTLNPSDKEKIWGRRGKKRMFTKANQTWFLNQNFKVRGKLNKPFKSVLVKKYRRVRRKLIRKFKFGQFKLVSGSKKNFFMPSYLYWKYNNTFLMSKMSRKNFSFRNNKSISDLILTSQKRFTSTDFTFNLKWRQQKTAWNILKGLRKKRKHFFRNNKPHNYLNKKLIDMNNPLKKNVRVIKSNWNTQVWKLSKLRYSFLKGLSKSKIRLIKSGLLKSFSSNKIKKNYLKYKNNDLLKKKMLKIERIQRKFEWLRLNRYFNKKINKRFARKTVKKNLV